MRTVKELIEELSKFNGSDECHAYEGEVTGIIINRGSEEGVIYCGEGSTKEKATEVIKA